MSLRRVPRGITRYRNRSCCGLVLSACLITLPALESVSFLTAGARPDMRSLTQIPVAAASPDVETDQLAVTQAAQAGVWNAEERELSSAEWAQVIVYKLALVTSGLLWLFVCASDLLLLGGGDLVDKKPAASCLEVVDIFSGIAALAVNAGSLATPFLAVRALGLVALAKPVLSTLGLGKLSAVAGPLCLVAVTGRELYWSGILSMPLPLISMPAFMAVAYLRLIASPSGEIPAPTLELEPALTGDAYLDALPVAKVPVPVGPPSPLNFLAAGSIWIISLQKLLESPGADFEEEGDGLTKPSANFVSLSDRRKQKSADAMFTEFDNLNAQNEKA